MMLPNRTASRLSGSRGLAHSLRAGTALALSIGVAFLVASLAGGCGGGSPDVHTATPPGAPPSNVPAPIQGGDQRATQQGSGWLYRFDMESPPDDNFGVTTREFYMYFKPDTNYVGFRIENRLGVAVKIVWDEMTFTDIYGRVWKVIHRGATYDSRNLPQEPTWIQGQKTYQDWVAPVDAMNDPQAAGGGPMRNILPTDRTAQSMVGKSFGFKLVLAADNNQKLEYDVRFRVASAYPGTR